MGNLFSLPRYSRVASYVLRNTVFRYHFRFGRMGFFHMSIHWRCVRFDLFAYRIGSREVAWVSRSSHIGSFPTDAPCRQGVPQNARGKDLLILVGFDVANSCVSVGGRDRKRCGLPMSAKARRNHRRWFEIELAEPCIRTPVLAHDTNHNLESHNNPSSNDSSRYLQPVPCRNGCLGWSPRTRS
jgi:hypothetical protein